MINTQSRQAASARATSAAARLSGSFGTFDTVSRHLDLIATLRDDREVWDSVQALEHMVWTRGLSAEQLSEARS